MKKTKFLLLSLIFVMCAGVMTGCGNTPNEDGSGTSEGILEEGVTKVSKGVDEVVTDVSKGAGEVVTKASEGMSKLEDGKTTTTQAPTQR